MKLLRLLPLLFAASTAHAATSVTEASVEQLQSAMTSGRATSQSITQSSLDRIRHLDRAGPSIGSVLETNPDALKAARSLDAERKVGRVRGPLHGIPVLLKDNIDTGDQMMTTAGSLALVGAPAPRDAFVVKRLREAGAVILGKTNLSEWANIRSSRSSSGWSARGGQTQNPYARDRNPCGSSSGTGAAIASSFAVVGVGTETNGSIVCPSGAMGLVGLKPTVGLVSRTGIIPISHSQAYLAGRPGVTVRSLQDVIAFNEKNAKREMSFFGQDLFVKAQAKGPLTDAAYLRAAEKSRRLARAGIDGVLAQHKLDAIIAPTGSPAWLTDHVNGDSFQGSSSSPAAVAGYPSITVPMGLAQGLPVGLSFVGKAWAEGKLLGLAFAYEQGTKHRLAPVFSRR